MWENSSSIKSVLGSNNYHYAEYKVENLTVAQLLDINDEKVTSLLNNDNVLIKLVDQKDMLLWREIEDCDVHGYYIESIIVVTYNGSK